MSTPGNDAGPAVTSGPGVRFDRHQNSTHTRPTPANPHPLFRWNGPETSKAAARSMREHTPRQRRRVMEAIEAAGPMGMTDGELGTLLNLGAQSVTPRRGELVTLGQVVKSGTTRATASGRGAIVWVAKRYAPIPNGREAAP